MRIIIDTNLWISFLLRSRIQSILSEILLDERVTLVSTQQLIDEIVSVATRKKFSKYITEDQVNSLVRYILEESEFYPLTNIPARCRDPKDDYLLELAIVSNANYLVTGDDDLLSLSHIEGCNIIDIGNMHSLL